jgi:diguanylate cyclase (GGDEF)-like protein
MNHISINKEKIQLLRKSIIISFFISAFLCLLISFHLKDKIPHDQLMPWLITSLSILLIRLLSVFPYKENTDITSGFTGKLIFFRIGAFLSGLTWGWCGYYFAGQVSLDSQLYISFMLAGLLAGAASSLSVDKLSMISFVLPTIAPNIIHYLMSEQDTSIGMALMLILFMLFIIYASLIQGKNILENIELRIKSHESEQKIQHLAFHDALTGLPNRSLFNDRIEQALCAEMRGKNPIAILFIDLDGFKHVNDSYGHAVGDELLQTIANRFKTIVRSYDTVARIGGDEFVVIVQKIEQRDDITKIANKLLREASNPMEISGHNINISSSIGIAIYPDHGTDKETLITNADNAMYLAKDNGKNTIQVHAA